MDSTCDTGRLSGLYLFIAKVAWRRAVLVVRMVAIASHAPLQPKRTPHESL